MSKTAYDVVCNALEKGIRFDAVQASNDQAVIGAIKALKEHHISVHGDVAVCGYDNLFPSTLISPAITTVSVPGDSNPAAAEKQVFTQSQSMSAAMDSALPSAVSFSSGSIPI
jgi:DNA-binding LacI/PurR family transcriptional regulator